MHIGEEKFLPRDINSQEFYDIYDTEFYSGRLTVVEIELYIENHNRGELSYLPPAVNQIIVSLHDLAVERGISFPKIAEEFCIHRPKRLQGALNTLIEKYREGEKLAAVEIQNISEKSSSTLESSFNDQCAIIDSQFQTMGYVFFLDYFTKAIYSYNNNYLINSFDKEFSEKVIDLSKKMLVGTQEIIEILLRDLQTGKKLFDSITSLDENTKDSKNNSKLKVNLDGIICSILEEDTDAKKLAEMIEKSCKGEIKFPQEVADLFILAPLIAFRLKTTLENFCEILIDRCLIDTSKTTEEIAYEFRIYLIGMKSALGI